MTIPYEAKQIENFKHINDLLRKEEQRISKTFTTFFNFAEKQKEEKLIADYECGLIISVFSSDEKLKQQYQIEPGEPLLIGFGSLPKFPDNSSNFLNEHQVLDCVGIDGLDCCYSMQVLWEDLQYFEAFDITSVRLELSFEIKNIAA